MINAAEKTMKEAIADPQKYGGNLEMATTHNQSNDS